MCWIGYWRKNNMNEYNEFLQDYKDCLDRIDNFENYNYIETELWVVKKYADWIKKDKRYELSLTCCTNKPLDDREKAWNAINNFKMTLDKIAIINIWKI